MVERDFDVIVVGAGASGIVTAARLAERGIDVALLEHGADWRSSGLDERLRRPFRSFAWTVESVPTDYLWTEVTARRHDSDEEGLYIRGRGVGGSTLINGMITLRPPLSEFSTWRAGGGTSWTREAVLTAFQRLENDHDYGSSELHGNQGPLPITRIARQGWGTVDELFAESARTLGHAWVGDVNGEGEDGMGYLPSAIVDGHRISVAHAYLDRPGTPDPKILAGCTVQRLEISGGRVTGVRVTQDGEERTLRADRLVLATGAIMTGAILQRSGIGPAALLAEVGVKPILDLPVGENLQEHLGFKFAMHMNGSAQAASNDTRGNVIARYSSGIEGFGEGDLVMHCANVSQYNADQPAEFCMVLGQAHSRGSLRIRSTNADIVPDVNLGLMSDTRDRKLAFRAYGDAFEMARTPALASQLRGLSSMNGEELVDPQDEDSVIAWLHTHGAGTAHVCATAPLGRVDDDFSVVDDKALVHGMENLWIGDLSITPTVPRANTQLTAMMIGERVADFLSGTDEVQDIPSRQ